MSANRSKRRATPRRRKKRPGRSKGRWIPAFAILAVAAPILIVSYPLSILSPVLGFGPGSDCDIKGNISRPSGEKIYHLPGQAFYNVTRIDLFRGERWFCSEEEAREAGWRRAFR